ncbi:MAG: hypothetical protein U0792_14250 [Gemmataceae bacterium]
MLAKKPDHRPPSAQVVAEELGAIAKAGEMPLAANATVPQVVYVPIAMTAMEQFTPTEFAELGDTRTEVIDIGQFRKSREERPGFVDRRRGRFAACCATAIGVVISLRKPTPETSPDPSSSSSPPPRRNRPSPCHRRSRSDPTPTGYGIRFCAPRASHRDTRLEHPRRVTVHSGGLHHGG